MELSSGFARRKPHQVATAKMATELRKILAQKGLDPSGYKLVAFGEPAPLKLQCLLKKPIWIILIPSLPGTF